MTLHFFRHATHLSKLSYMILCLSFISFTLMHTDICLAEKSIPTLKQEEKILALHPGQYITLHGDNFGTIPDPDAQICLGFPNCTTPQELHKLITAWTNTTISFELPDKEFQEHGHIEVYFPTLNSDVLIGPAFTFQNYHPEITSIFPQNAEPGSQVTLSGFDFGSKFNKENKLCLIEDEKDLCFYGNNLNSQKIQWDQGKISFLLPQRTYKNTAQFAIYSRKYLSISGQAIVSRTVSPTINITTSSDPIITQIEPTLWIPESTEVHITGQHFGSTLQPQDHQICLDTLCIPADQMKNYIIKWSSEEIIFRVPEFMNTIDNGKPSIRLYAHRDQAYKRYHLKTPIVIIHIPEITTYHKSIKNNQQYTIHGKRFGTTQGNIYINNKPSKIHNWNDTEIIFSHSFKETKKDTMVIATKENIRSKHIAIQLVYEKVYSFDPLSSYQWYLETINAFISWKKEILNKKIIIAVIDSGIDITHEDIKDSIWRNTKEIPNNNQDDDLNGYIDDIHGWNVISNTGNIAPTNEHGTLVASIISAQKDNGMGFAGVSSDIKIMPIVIDQSPINTNKIKQEYMHLAHAVEYAIKNGARIINMSFEVQSQKDFYGPIIQYAYNNNALIVASVGNNNKNLDTEHISPVCDESKQNEILGVSATNKKNQKASFSNYGKCSDISAPGEDIVVAIPKQFIKKDEEQYGLASGTSFATPFVSAAAGVLLALHPDWNVEEVKSSLLDSVDTLPFSKQYLGKGMLNLDRLLKMQRPNVAYNPKQASTPEPLEESFFMVKDEDSYYKDFHISIDPKLNTVVESTQSNITHVLRSIKDVEMDSPYYEAIEYMNRQNIFAKNNIGLFQPKKSISREKFLETIVKIYPISIPSGYKDCSPTISDSHFEKFVCWGWAHSLIEGTKTSDNILSLNSSTPISRGDAVRALSILFQLQDNKLMKIPFHDIQDTSTIAIYIRSALEAKILPLFDFKNTFDQNKALSKEEFSYMLYHLLEE